MGNISPRSSKSFHDGFTNHLTITPSRSSTSTSWKKQLQIINKTLNIKKFSRNHANNKIKRIETTTLNENKNVKKSFSLFSMKQSLNDLTNKENQLVNSTNHHRHVPHRCKSKHDRVTSKNSNELFICFF